VPLIDFDESWEFEPKQEGALTGYFLSLERMTRRGKTRRRHVIFFLFLPFLCPIFDFFIFFFSSCLLSILEGDGMTKNESTSKKKNENYRR